jgi:hypothetical protein
MDHGFSPRGGRSEPCISLQKKKKPNCFMHPSSHNRSHNTAISERQRQKLKQKIRVLTSSYRSVYARPTITETLKEVDTGILTKMCPHIPVSFKIEQQYGHLT